jgi:DNA repair photolyase
MTVTTADDKLCKKIEPHVAVTSKRFSALKKLADAGIATSVYICPILPFITDTKENITEIVRMAHENGVGHIYIAYGVTARQNQRVYFYNQLDILFPGVKDKYVKAFGLNYECPAPNYKQLHQVFERECEKYGIAHKYGDIIKYLDESVKQKQTTFL